MLCFLFAFALLLVGTSVQSATVDTSERKDLKEYGNCKVFTSIDLFTDEEDHFLHCLSPDLSVSFVIYHSPSNSELLIGLQAGTQSPLSVHLPVAIRVDKGQVIRQQALLLGGEMVNFADSQIAESLLSQIESGQKLIIKVGTETGVIDITGADQAITDFRSRVKINPQTLEVQ